MKTKIHILLANITVGAALMLLSICATQASTATNVVPSTTTDKTVTTDKPAAAATVETPKTNSIATASTATTNAVALKVVKVDSEETAGEDGKGANAVDGDPETIWHTQWQDDSPACPHEILRSAQRS